MITNLAERYRSRVLLAAQTTAAAAQAYLPPTPGLISQTYRAIVTKGNAADLTLTLRYADDAAGANAANYPVDVPIYINGVRQANGKTATVAGAAGSSVVDFCIDPATIPQGKFVGLSFAISNAATLLAAELIEDVSYRPTPS
ncbi:hypothetical protein PSTEL_09645 [Paenibacillus stellifer]|uniref:Uncharacterized protein n=1 Tax=Paenibacillus stellifer TaxID=169760 RepID=A0A089N3M6_9BACL|nr:hypothetical protein [Paenibacillus stellifer]AIQ63309.1 hypothetical protein PSTEL_09645 [Paenibacillus stellifer]